MIKRLLTEIKHGGNISDQIIQRLNQQTRDILFNSFGFWMYTSSSELKP